MSRATHTPAAPLATEPQAPSAPTSNPTSASTAPALALPSQPEEVEPFTLELEFPDDQQANQQATPAAATDAAQGKLDPAREALREALQTIHMEANTQLATIESLARLVLHAMESPGFYGDRPWELVADTLGTIAALALDLQNTVSVEVEGQGCAYSCPREAARWAARRHLRPVLSPLAG